MIALLVITDGRLSYLSETVASAERMLTGPIDERWMFDDSGDAAHRDLLRSTYPGFAHINAGGRQGFGGAIQAAWRTLVERSRADYIFHLEQDFTFNRPVDLTAMAHVLDANPHLVQLALRRQPWNDEESAAGGIVEQYPDDYAEVTDGPHTWLEHRRFMTTNPSLYRRSLCRRGWPEGKNTEGRFGIELFKDPNARCGFWGGRDSGEAVTHIGRQRVGTGY